MAPSSAHPRQPHDVEAILRASRDARMRARVLAAESAELRFLSAQLRATLVDGDRAIRLHALYRPIGPR
jgi:hypothetical protein